MSRHPILSLGPPSLSPEHTRRSYKVRSHENHPRYPMCCALALLRVHPKPNVAIDVDWVFCNSAKSMCCKKVSSKRNTRSRIMAHRPVGVAVVAAVAEVLAPALPRRPQPLPHPPLLRPPPLCHPPLPPGSPLLWSSAPHSPGCSAEPGSLSSHLPPHRHRPRCVPTPRGAGLARWLSSFRRWPAHASSSCSPSYCCFVLAGAAGGQGPLAPGSWPF